MLTAESTKTGTIYLTADHLGSPRINTDGSGNVVARHDYMPFGEEISTSQRTSTVGYSADSVRKQFTGYERDGETGLDFAEARVYLSPLGRFGSADPASAGATLAMPQSFNSYAYTDNNPINRVDPMGLKSESPEWGGFDRCQAAMYIGCGVSPDDSYTGDDLPSEINDLIHSKRQTLPGSGWVVAGWFTESLKGAVQVDISSQMMADLWDASSSAYSRGLNEGRLYRDARAEIGRNLDALATARSASSTVGGSFTVTDRGPGSYIFVNEDINPDDGFLSYTSRWGAIPHNPYTDEAEEVPVTWNAVREYNDVLAKDNNYLAHRRESFVRKYKLQATTLYIGGKLQYSNVRFGKAAGALFDQYVNAARRRGFTD